MSLLNDDIPDIDDAEIEKEAMTLLEDFYKRSVAVEDTPIPVELIAEQHLDYEIDIVRGDLFPHPDLLGGILFKDRVIQIASAVEGHEGRYNFTIAHEIGHHVLHREIYLAKQENNDTSGMCRKMGRKPKAESQADRFAAALLMPAILVEKAVERAGCKKALSKTKSVYTAHRAAAQVAKEGSFFNVSNTAIMNRLIHLQFITDVPYQSTPTNSNFRRIKGRLSYAGHLLKNFLTKCVRRK